MSRANPFDEIYLAESIAADDLLDRYSFRPFLTIQGQMSRAINVFLVGRRGVGKTMLLRLFSPDLIGRLYESSLDEHRRVRSALPKATVGIYLNLASPFLRLGRFRGPAFQSDQQWRAAFGDYLNCVMLDQALGSMDRMAAIEGWRKDGGWTCETPTADTGFADDLVAGLRGESRHFDSIDSVQALRRWCVDRSQEWVRFVGGEGPAPESRLPLGIPLFILADVVRKRRLCSERFRLFVLVDQYEQLYAQRAELDLRPLFNQTMYEALRGGTGVEFKIGTRPYAHDNLSLLDGHARLEQLREVLEVDLDDIAKKYYPKFAEELLVKRLAAAGESSQRLTPAERFPALSPSDEAQQYVLNSTAEGWRQFASFIQRWAKYGLPTDELQRELERNEMGGLHPLSSTLACIAVTRWLRDGEKGTPLGCEREPEAATRAASAVMYVRQLALLIDERYQLGNAKARGASGLLRRVDNFVRDAEGPALFQLASAYKNQRKIYCGLDTIIRVSSNVAIVFIEILRVAYERASLDSRQALTRPVSIANQSEAMYQVSDTLLRGIPTEYDYGQSLYEFVLGLGTSLRQLQLEPSVPQPSPNGFSISLRDETQLFNQPFDRDDSAQLLRAAVSWGLLETELHKDKSRGRSARRKYYLNRAFCPVFGLSEIHRKDPMYLEDIAGFVSGVRKRELPKEVRVLLERSAKPSRRASRPAQTLLAGLDSDV